MSGKVDTLARHDKALFERFMGFPPELPNLAERKPPRNRRPQGIFESYYAQRERGELPAVY